MPSLHIGLPFAIWLTMTRWDEDGRWLRFRRFLVIFLALTAFSIIYLGIHWAIDIIGGMIVAIVAVSVTERTHKGIWTIADERLFTRKIAKLIDDPKIFLRGSRNYVLERSFPCSRNQWSKQTSVFIAKINFQPASYFYGMLRTKSFPSKASNGRPSAGSDDWLIGIEVDPKLDGINDIEITALNTSLEERQGVIISWT